MFCHFNFSAPFNLSESLLYGKYCCWSPLSGNISLISENKKESELWQGYCSILHCTIYSETPLLVNQIYRKCKFNEWFIFSMHHFLLSDKSNLIKTLIWFLTFGYRFGSARNKYKDQSWTFKQIYKVLPNLISTHL